MARMNNIPTKLRKELSEDPFYARCVRSGRDCKGRTRTNIDLCSPLDCDKISIMQTKLCSKCGKQRAMKFFVRDKTKKNGLYSSCKDCYRERTGGEKRQPIMKFMRDGSGLHWCNRCKRYKSTYFFYRNPSNRTGFHSQCKKCSIELASSPRAKATAMNYRQKERLLVINHYGGSPPKCKCCEEGVYQFLAIDHINGGGGKHRRKIGTSHFYRWLLQNGLPTGYQVLCHNCNMAKGFYGKCPHVINETNQQEK